MSIIENLKFNLMLKSRKNKLEYFLNEACGGKWTKILDVGVADLEHSPFDIFLEITA